MRKKRPVLYEVCRRPTKSADPVFRPRPVRPLPETDQSLPGRMSDLETPPHVVTPLGPPSSGAPDRWQVVISGPTLAVLIAVVVVLLLVVFAAGRRYEARYPSVVAGTLLAQEQSDEADTGWQDDTSVGDDPSAAAETNNRSAVAPAPTDEPSSTAERGTSESTRSGPAQVTLRKGYHYVVVQHFGKKRERQAALEAARYLRENGVECATLPGADIRVIVTEPFLISQQDAAAAREQRRRANQLMRRIRELGQQYNKELIKQDKRGYTFSECYLFELK